MVDRVTIAISRETADRLRSLGRYGDTMDSIIQRVLNEYENLDKEPAQVVRSVLMALSLPFIVNAMSSAAFLPLPAL
jgi:hypothetical protein